MQPSSFGAKLTDKNISITRLMQDLATGLAMPNHYMLGGGNPGYVPEVLERLQLELSECAADTNRVRDLLADYSLPAGDAGFRRALAEQFKHRYGWDIGEDNIALTNGSQSAFFSLFNLFAGDGLQETKKHILFPLVPEYIGYRDTGVSDQMFRAVAPRVDIDQDNKSFKYHIDWDALRLDEHTGALCVSRPCNPTGNVITNDELTQLQAMARDANVPLIIDNAYGEPFPGIVFTDCHALFDDNCIQVFSLSKFGLPASRTGIVIAHEAIIHQIATMNAVLTLAPSAIGARLMQKIVSSGEIFSLSQQAIRPFYQKKAQRANAFLKNALAGYPCYLHKIEGGIFLWLWCQHLPCSGYDLYQILQKNAVTVVPGSYFFPGLEQPHPHKDATIRISYAGDNAMVDQGLAIIAREIISVYESA